jgi:hypothetical protein
MKRLNTNTVSLQSSEYGLAVCQNGHILKTVAIYKVLKFKILEKMWLSAPQMSVLNGLRNGLIDNW